MMMSELQQVQKRPKRIAMYVIYDKDGILDGYRKYYLQELRKHVDHILVVVSGTLTPESREELSELSDDFFVRENKGLLAGSWLDGIAHIGWKTLEEYDQLLMLNDSFFGPFFDLTDFFDAMEKSDSDFYGSMRNFEEKSFTQMNGRGFKHGHLRGSICYFYVIKSKLLHSAEFKKYWSQSPDIKGDWDTYFFAELDFYDYVLDCGFKIDSYQTEKFKGYTFDNLTQNLFGLVKDEKIPFARIRPIASDIKLQSMQINYGNDARKALDYIDKNTPYDINLVWDYILRTKNLTHIYNQLQLQYVVSNKCVEQEFSYEKPIAVILHIYYSDCVEEIADYCGNFPVNTHFYITTTDEATHDRIEKVFTNKNLIFQVKIRPNVGVAMSSLWVTFSDVILSEKYEYICYFHDKKSPYSKYNIQGLQFANRCYENLFGNEYIVKNILNLFEENKRLGMIGPPLVYHGDYFSVALRSWQGNYENTKKLAERLNIKVDIDPYVTPVAPYGDMFWFRAAALKNAVSIGFTYDDFDVEYKPDFTFMHAIERIYAFAVQDAGYYYADVINTDEARTDLINYQYMIHQFSSIMMQHGYHPYNYVVAEQIIHKLNNSDKLSKIQIKRLIRTKVPRPFWKIAKKIYHLFGGKKWLDETLCR